MNIPAPSVEGLRIAGITLLASVLSVGLAAGQSRQSGEIRGTVTDSSGGVIPGVAISIKNLATGVVQRTTTDATGLYDAPSVPVGPYSVTFSKEGFKEFIRSNVDMRLETITLNAQLDVGATTQSVTVTAPVALVQTENAEQSTTLTAAPVTELPNVGASWYNLLSVIPGVNQGGSSMNYGGANGSNVGVNGMGGLNSNWQVDGGRAFLVMDVNPDWMQPPLDDIQEIKMLTANFGAEYGNGTSVFNVVTKSGTNHFHGDAFEYVENNIFNARNWFTIGPQTPLRWNKFGASIGGPIKHDKLFFHFNYQQNTNIADYPSFATFPTPDMLAGKFTDPNLQTIYDPATLAFQNGNYVNQPFQNNTIPQARFDKVSAAIAANFPQPNLPGLYNNFYWVDRVTEPGKWINTKIDYNISSSQRLTGNLEIVPAHLGYPAADPLIDNDGWDIKEYQSEITDVWTISPRLVGEFRVSFAREHGAYQSVATGKGWPQKLGLANPVADMFPSTTIEGTLGTSIGTGGTGLDTEVGYGPGADFTWVKGKHVIKWGGEFTKDWVNTNGSQEGAFDFNGIFTRNPSISTSSGEGFADFLLGLPDTWSVSDTPTTGQRMWTAQPFVQDEYKIRPNLTLSAGVRWVIQSGYGEAYNRISNFDPTLINDATGTPGAMTYAGEGWTHLENTHYHFFAPRVGFAWTPKPNWSIRGGYGVFSILWAQYNYDNYNNVAQGWGISGFETSSDLIHPIFTMQQGAPPPLYPTSATRTNSFLNGQSVGYVSPNIPMGYNQQYRLDIQHQMRGGVLIDVAYVGNRSLHMPATGSWRDMNQVPENLLGLGNAQAVRPFPQFAAITDYDPVDYGEYNALQISAKKDMGHGILFAVNYAWSHSLDSMTANGGTGAPSVWQDAYTPQADYGSSPVDQRNVLNGNFIYRLPVGRGRHFLNRGGWGDAVLGGWELTSVFTARNGTPFTPYMGTDNLSGALSGTWRPNRIGSGKLANPTINGWFDTSAFVEPNPYTFGNSGRDILYGPPFTDMDFALSKKFPITKLGEGGSLTFKAETYDTFDSPNFNQPAAGIGVAGAGVISSALDNRLLQFGLMLNF